MNGRRAPPRADESDAVGADEGKGKWGHSAASSDAGFRRFRHGPQPRPDGCAMSGAKSGLTASLVGRHCSPSPGKFDECVALSWSRGTNGEGITKSRKLFAFFIRHDALLQPQGGNITLLERACGAHASWRIQSGNLPDAETRRSPA